MQGKRLTFGGIAAAALVCTLLASLATIDTTPAPLDVEEVTPQHLQAPPQNAATSDQDRLWQNFPHVASEIVDSPGVLIPIGDIHGSGGFAMALSEETNPASHLPVILPSHGDEPIQFLVGTPHALEVQHSGTRGPGRVVGNAIAYDADHGTSYWVATEDGYEEWLEVEHPTDGVIASYDIDGATPVKNGDAVVLMDDDGIALLDVEAPAAWTTDGRPVEVSLDVGNDRIDLAIALPDNTRGPVLVDPVWTRVDDMGFGRLIHTATRLLDGRVLVAGGIGEAGTVTDSVEIFDPRTNSWSPAAPLPVALRSHNQALLPDGRVLLAHGKSNGFGALNLAFIYDPETDSWTDADPLRSLVGGPATWIPSQSVALPNGKVLFSGQYCCSGKQAWVYDPELDQFHPIADMHVHRLQHTLTVLPDGSILAAGGGTTNATGLNSNTAELYVPDFNSATPYLDGSWELLPNMNSGHFDHGAALLTTGPNTGKVLICAGLDGSTVPGSYLFNAACDLFDPATRTFSVAGTLGAARQRSGTQNGGDFLKRVDAGPNEGDILVAGGWPVTWRTDLYDLESDTWTEGCWLNSARLRHTTTPLLDGRVLLTGGQMWAFAPLDAALRTSETIDYTLEDDDCDGIANDFDICADNPIDRDYNPVDKWCGTVTGRVYFDQDEDCVDNVETGAPGILVRADLPGQQTRYAVTNEDGMYELDLPDGQWDITMVERSYLEAVDVCGGFAKSYSVDAKLAPGDLNFGLKPECEGTVAISGGSGNLLECNGVPYTSPCPGSSWVYTVYASNQGMNWNSSSTMSITIPSGMNYFSGATCSCCNGPPTVQNAGGVTTLVFPMGPVIQTGDMCTFTVPVDVNSIPAGGWLATASLDAGCANNTFQQGAASLTTDSCSCDPNDKSVNPFGCDLDGTLEVAEPLDYRVRFQNLGLGPAHDVVITDAIDPDLDLESLRVKYSDPEITSLQIDETGLVVIRYDDIELPAAIDDPFGSQGEIHFELEPLITVDGTVYTNTADIYFDNNEPVITNEVVNTIGICPDLPPGHDPLGPARAGVANNTNPGQGAGLVNNPANGLAPNPNNAP